MSHFTFADFLTASQGVAVTSSQPFSAARLWTDTRTLQAGDFFLPLSGERFDGHNYLRQAFQDGAVGAFVSQVQWEQHPEWVELPNLIAVPEPILAYLAMARLHRERINPIVIAVTGSSGKTTTKEMLYAALSPLRKTVKTEKNFNNEVGVSQTLLALQPCTEVLIVEMGMRGLRQISLLSQAARPDVAIVVNVGSAHIGMLGSLENIAKAKLEIVEGMTPEQGVLVVNGDNALLSEWSPRLWSGKLVAYHLSEASHVQLDAGEGVAFEYKNVPVRLGVPGEHMVANALGVLKVGEAISMDLSALARNLSAFVPEKGRWERTQLANFHNVWVINDAYNANPDSAMASIKALLAKRHNGLRNVLVLGGMKELGDFSMPYHRSLGEWLALQPHIDALFTVGEESICLADAARTGVFPVYHAQTLDELAMQVLQFASPLENLLLYLKGSRAYGLDELPERLHAQAQVVSAGKVSECF